MAVPLAVAKEFHGRPVKVIWSREEVFRQGRYRPPITAKYCALFDDISGLPRAFQGDMAYSGVATADTCS